MKPEQPQASSCRSQASHFSASSFAACGLLLLFGVVLAGCNKSKADANATAPTPAVVVPDMDANNFKVDHPERFMLATASEYKAAPELNVTGVVTPDVSRTVPVISLATGKVIEIHARLGDVVKKGQLLLRVQSSDVAGAFSDYRKAVNDERLARVQFERAQLLFEKGAVAKSVLETFEGAEQDAKVTLETALEHLRLLGVDKDHPTGVVDIHAPVSGVITDQQVTNAAGVQGLSGPNPFTISDVSHVWIVCDVYENSLPQVHIGDYADIRLNAYPDKLLKGRVSNIGAILDPNIRTAKVRLEVQNPGLMRLGMFVTASFHGQALETHAAVPVTAVLHLHDRHWVFVPLEEGHFRRLEVVAGDMLAGNLQEIVSGLKPGAQVVQNALALQNTVEQ
jgi:cobalt-zinc-cadmium efflux system membrane fusion protein